MADQMMGLVQRTGDLIGEINEKFYFYLDIETFIPWLIVFLLYVLYKFVSAYFEDKQLDSLELIKLLGIYFLILFITIASYVDIRRIGAGDNPEYSFFMLITAMAIIVVILAWASRDPNSQKRWILGALFVPILLLMLTNGRILEDRLNAIYGIFPRSDLSFINLYGEVKALRLGGYISADQVKNLEEIISSHRAVYESAIVGYRDEDNLVKPYAFVLLESKVTGTKILKKDILKHVENRIQENWIPPNVVPAYMDFVPRERLPKTQYPKIGRMMDGHPAVAISSVVGQRDEAIAYVVLNEGYSDTSNLKREILNFVYNIIRNNNKMSPYLIPRWIDFIDKEKVPRDKNGEIRRHILQKRVKNWSNVFPQRPEKTFFEKIEEGR